MLNSFVALLMFLFMFPAQSAFNGERSGTVAATAGGGGGITVVNTAVVGNLPIISEATTETLGFTTGSGHFFVAMGYTSGDFVGATLEPSGTAMTCPSANELDGARTTILVCYLANGPSGQTSVTWTYSSSNVATAESAFGGECGGYLMVTAKTKVKENLYKRANHAVVEHSAASNWVARRACVASCRWCQLIEPPHIHVAGVGLMLYTVVPRRES